ncbi:type I restriction enzyme, S subunit [Bathymodiolus platifrons methanotrophic gill symbiont]|uniref:restriction endonuclease subunit S n=1 Tax=Bathymodiolus platifrons methanotrophic gill symbiont TaxID=113268 RepID=UPI000B41A6A2|nr:restriction endonuclease subunit S [Bathymodiolus platifrons methanotrophic gill symbiont]GAW87504.1 type I restriction enzyme, S subunit [Bathymodiolus platifrons methanotrophic gill symbiont]GFO75853.1 type I restriction enzyme, S subunit [Bathymodiolus platifrons methanotrophic gill symbiont]
MRFRLSTIGSYAKVQGGFAYKSKDFLDNGRFKVLKIKNVRFGIVDYEDTAYISKDIADKTISYSTSEGDILISMTGSGPNAPQSLVGRVARVWANEPKSWINQRVGRLILKNINSIHSDFLYYVFLLKSSQEFLVSNSSGSANQANISGKLIESLPCPDVNYEQSKKISRILKSLDEKIILNNKTNETLEKLAQALFKSWFVDFDPVKAKEKLKQEGGDLDLIAKELGMSKEILELFPDEFQESDLGIIPKGWELKPLYETAEYINGSSFKAKDFSDKNEGLPIIKIAELKQGISAGTKFTLNDIKSKYFIDSGDVLYSWSGSPETSLEVFKWHGGKGWLNQHIFKLNFDSLQQRNFTYFLLKQIKPLLISTAKQKQTTGLGHITVADMKRIKITYPDNDVLKKFSEQINPLYERSSKLIEETGTLTKLRDALLPKLLSGEITFKGQT